MIHDEFHFDINQFSPQNCRFKGGGSPPAVEPLPPQPIKVSNEVKAAKRDVEERAKRLRGRQESILTTPSMLTLNPDLYIPKLRDKLGTRST